jgi:hypothetical protein
MELKTQSWDSLLQKREREGWSEARQQAFSQIDTNPNAYYYRFNAPGESARHGAWTADEHRLFLERLIALPGARNNWGHFSMSIPGVC